MADNDISLNSGLFASVVRVSRRLRADDMIHEAMIPAEYFDPRKCDPEDIAELCVRRREVDLAVQARSLADPPPPETAIYLIGPKEGGTCKIGVAKNPAKRLTMVQIGCWQELIIHGLFWFIDGSAFGVEALAHRIASKMGKRLQGEWVDMDPAGAAYVVASVVHSTKVKVADSGMWLRQRQELMRTKGLIAETLAVEPCETGYRMSSMDVEPRRARKR